ncbi:MAG: hypothetical protein E7675_08230 [Ruminococcaceae bacterium]|nr:hypothetical protein [Oscillospiraceae bacterium]
MLQKILKYDLKAIFKYWWILAVSSFGMSILGGLAFNIVYNIDEMDSPASPFIILGGVLLIFVAFFSIFAFIIGNEIFVILRFYRNFFTDEGYLTFTLPVSRAQLLNSKIISATIANLSTGALAIIEFLLLFGLSPMWDQFLEIFNAMSEAPPTDTVIEGSPIAIIIGVLLTLIIIIAIVAIAAICSTLITYCCITIAAVISKKHKVLSAIGLYYAVSIVYSNVSQIGSLLTSSGIMYYIMQQTSVAATLSVLVLLILILGLTCAATLGLYTLALYMLHRKLNLS